jgi:hypothetical protein
MALNLTTLLPAKINTSEIATKYDVSSSIAAYNPATAINANTTTIDGGKITTGSITAGQIAANTITTSKLTTNIGLVNGYVYSSNFNGNVSGNIGTPTQGFRLSSSAAGTSSDPTIYGAYIKGSIVEASKITTSTNIINPMYPDNSGNAIAANSMDYTASYINSLAQGFGYGGTMTFLGYSYGSGFYSNRILSNTPTFIISINALSGNIVTTIEVSVDNTIWQTIKTVSGTSLVATYIAPSGANNLYFRYGAHSSSSSVFPYYGSCVIQLCNI